MWIFEEEESKVRAKLKEISNNGKRNARQAVEGVKGPFSKIEAPAFPEEVSGEAPERINAYTDGGVRHPTTEWVSLGGYGIWWPGGGRAPKIQTEPNSSCSRKKMKEEPSSGAAYRGKDAIPHELSLLLR